MFKRFLIVLLFVFVVFALLHPSTLKTLEKGRDAARQATKTATGL